MCASVAGCGGASQNVKTQNQELRATVSTLRTDARRDRMRIRDLEKQIALLEQQRGPREQAPAGELAPAPDLPVEVRTPETLGSADELPDDYEVVGTDADGVQIVYVGEAAADESVRPPVDRYDLSQGDSPAPSSRRARRGGETRELAPVPQISDRLAVTDSVPRIDSTLRQARTPTPRSRATAVDPRAEYRRYYEALRAGNHAFAITGFRNFVARFPGHEYADNAQYWLGEAFYDQKKYGDALAEFQRVVAKHPSGNKVPDALLKVGYCHARLGDEGAARAALEEVTSRFPKSNPASLARKKLAELED